ncbi:hypothetical protein [Cyclobacterium sp.]|uniref:hypothetical protein n=1 Tax=Cyclobacterium sp. TaxID=1966343 RepID=UPI00199EA87E|nr:hypothetical protein [Cyclobacterium sp.]MBD3630592.1 hypothetical protein [Cyclobacterium sp.]
MDLISPIRYWLFFTNKESLWAWISVTENNKKIKKRYMERLIMSFFYAKMLGLILGKEKVWWYL